MKLHRIRAGKDISSAEQEKVRRSLLQKVRGAIQTPVSHATFVADEVTARLVQLFSRVRPLMHSDEASEVDVLWLITKHVLVPTAHLVVRERRHCGLGAEFASYVPQTKEERERVGSDSEFLRGECWYLPEQDGHRIRKPVPRVLDCWLRVAGLQADNRLSKQLGNDSVRKKVNGWLKGEHNPTLDDLHNLVDEFAAKVTWLDTADSWKARFTLARAAQRAWDDVDSFFRAACRYPSVSLAKDFREMALKPVLHDAHGLLVLPDMFFATRLLQARLEREGNFERIVERAGTMRCDSFGELVTDEQIEQCKRQAEYEANPGNWFLEFVRREAVTAKRIKRDCDPLDAQYALKEYLFDIGVTELNRLLRTNKKGAGG